MSPRSGCSALLCSSSCCCLKCLELVSPRLDRQKAFDRPGVDATLVLLHEAGVTGQLWALIAQFLRHTQSQVRLGALLSEPWEDPGIAQGGVLSPLLFDLLIDGFAHAVHESAPGVRLSPNCDWRFGGELYADDLVVAAECEPDLQTALDAVAIWGHKLRFEFNAKPTKPAVMVFGP